MSNEVVMKFPLVVNTLPELLALIEKEGIDNVVINDFDVNDIQPYDELINDIYKLIDIVPSDWKFDIINKLIFNTRVISDCDYEVINQLIELAIKHKISLGYRLPSTISIEQLTVLADNNLCEFFYIENLPCLTVEFVKKHGIKMDLGVLSYNENKEIAQAANDLVNEINNEGVINV